MLFVFEIISLSESSTCENEVTKTNTMHINAIFMSHSPVLKISLRMRYLTSNYINGSNLKVVDVFFKTEVGYMLYRFQIDLSDIDKGNYQTLDFRVALHPSESMPYLLTRVLAFALNYQDGLEFSPDGLGNSDSSALRKLGHNGETILSIEIGNPSARRLHKTSKFAKTVKVYTYKSAQVVIDEIRNNEVYKSEQIEIFELDPIFLKQLEGIIEKNNRWSLVSQQGQIDVTYAKQSISGQIKQFFPKGKK